MACRPHQVLWLAAFLAVAQVFLLMREAKADESPVATLTPARLRVEYLSEPLGVETLSPRLSWGFNSTNRGARQSGYHILAAST